jgi:hypothetical protein
MVIDKDWLKEHYASEARDKRNAKVCLIFFIVAAIVISALSA